MKFVPNFKILGQVVPEKSLMKISIFIILEREKEKVKQKKNAKLSLNTLVLFSVIQLVILILYIKFEDSSTHRCLADMMENFTGKKEKWTNKGTDKQYITDSLLHCTSCHTQPLYQI